MAPSPACRSSRSRRARSDSRRTSTYSAPHTGAAPPPQGLTLLRLPPLSLLGFELAPDDLAAIATLDRGKRFNDPGVFSEGMNAFLPIYD